MERFRVLTYNVLHGLDVKGWRVTVSESEEARKARLSLQVGQMALVQPDVILLQEVNPLPRRAQEYVDGLKALGLHYTEVHQADACGIRLFGRGLVPAVNNGLVVMVKAPLRVRKLAGLKLSGGFGGCGEFFGWHLSELRYALIAEVEHPGTGHTFIAVSLHLHSGIQRAAKLLRQAAEAEREGRLRREDVHAAVVALEESQDRRLEEIRVLVKELMKLQVEDTYMGAIVGGDFNFEPGSAEYRELQRAGLKDSFLIAGEGHSGFSFDPIDNPIAGRGKRLLPPSLRRVIQSLSDEQQQKIVESYFTNLGQARRIDFLFHMEKFPNQPQGCFRQALFGKPTAISVLPGSDHYGVLNTYIADPAHC